MPILIPRRGLTPFMFFAIFLLFSSPTVFASQTARDRGSDIGGESSKDLDEKIDIAISVLGIIRDEMRDIDRRSDASDTDEGGFTAGNLADWFERANRVWKKVTRASGHMPDDTEQEKDLVDTTAISHRLGAAIEMMADIKYEFDKRRKEKGEKND